MSETDMILIKNAFLTSEWSEIEQLKIKAESDEARQILQDRKMHLYRKEESFANQL